MATTKRSKTVDIPYVLCRGDSDPFTHQARPDSDRTLCGQVAGERVRRRVMACAACYHAQELACGRDPARHWKEEKAKEDAIAAARAARSAEVLRDPRRRVVHVQLEAPFPGRAEGSDGMWPVKVSIPASTEDWETIFEALPDEQIENLIRAASRVRNGRDSVRKHLEDADGSGGSTP